MLYLVIQPCGVEPAAMIVPMISCLACVYVIIAVISVGFKLQIFTIPFHNYNVDYYCKYLKSPSY